eukprot:9497753-Pyramimonas_sp.AAC.2
MLTPFRWDSLCARAWWETDTMSRTLQPGDLSAPPLGRQLMKLSEKLGPKPAGKTVCYHGEYYHIDHYETNGPVPIIWAPVGARSASKQMAVQVRQPYHRLLRYILRGALYMTGERSRWPYRCASRAPAQRVASFASPRIIY